ncbi:hypothetical protein BDF22DRAFT_412185 [Syncephalis plumigaleata]|nr:hypothetical protein BDF22DRAFT_412185 [Syncephalis plumigaleata]
MVWGNSDNQATVDGWIHRLHTNDAHFVSLHIMTARRLTTEQFTQLFNALGKNHTLAQLYCAGHTQSDASLSALAEALGQYNRTLQSLTLGDPQLTSNAFHGFQSLCVAIGVNKTLQTLDWSNCGFGLTEEATLKKLGESLEKMLARNAGLSQVTLSHNELGNAIISSIAAGIRANNVAQGALVNLDLSYNKLGLDAITSLTTALIPAVAREPKHGLREVNLSGNPDIGVTGMTQLGCTLSHPASACRKIILSDCHATEENTAEGQKNDATHEITVGDAFLAALNETSKDVLATTLDLEEIKLDRCAVTVTGANHLAQLLARPGNRLCEITLRGNTLGDKGVSQLAVPAVPLPSTAAADTRTISNHTVTADITGILLDLSENNITDEGLAALLVSDTSAITQLVLYGNQISLSETFFEQVTTKWTSSRMAITLLDLSGNKIDTAAFERLADALVTGALPNLRKLELAGNVDTTKDEEARTAWQSIATRISTSRTELVLLWY